MALATVFNLSVHLVFIHYYISYPMEQSPSWEANRFSASQEIPRILWNPKFITTFTSNRHLFLSYYISTSKKCNFVSTNRIVKQPESLRYIRTGLNTKLKPPFHYMWTSANFAPATSTLLFSYKQNN